MVLPLEPISVVHSITVLFNIMLTLRFKAQPTNAFFTTVKEMFSSFSQLLTSAKCMVMKLLSTVQKIKQYSALVRSWEDLQII